MTATEREQARLSILRYIAAARGHGLTAPLLLQYLRSEGQQIDRAQIDAEVLYLADKGLIASVEKSISPENKAWRITAVGRDQLAENE